MCKRALILCECKSLKVSQSSSVTPVREQLRQSEWVPPRWIKVSVKANPVILFLVSLHLPVSCQPTPSSSSPCSAPRIWATDMKASPFSVYKFSPLTSVYHSSRFSQFRPHFCSVKSFASCFPTPSPRTLSFWVPSACQLPPTRGSHVSGCAFICQWSDLMWDWDKLGRSVVFFLLGAVWWRCLHFISVCGYFYLFLFFNLVWFDRREKKKLVVLSRMPNNKVRSRGSVTR